MGRAKTSTHEKWFVRLRAAAMVAACLALGAGLAWAEEAAPAADPSGGEVGATPAQPAAPAPPPAPPAPGPPVTSVVIKPAAGAPAKEMPAEDVRIELHVKGDTLANVIELLSNQYQLNIVASSSAKGKVSADLYGVTVEQALDAICRAAGLLWVREGGCIYLHTADEMKAIKLDEGRLQSEVFTLNYLTSEEAIRLIAPVLSAKATSVATTAAATGIPSGAEEAGGNSLVAADAIIVRDFPENLEQVAKIIKKMDQRPKQVLVEATILQVTLVDNTTLGVNFNALAGVDFRDLATVGATATADAAPGAVAADLSTTARAGSGPWGEANTQGFAARGAGLNIGLITNNISIFINALEEVTDTTVLSNPKVLTLNKQPAEVNVGDQIGYRGEVTQTETAQTQDVQFMDVGTRLAFRPFITDDGYIRLEIHPEVSQRGGETIDGVPSKATAEVTCNVLVKDGNTIVIGGMFEETAQISREQVPGLGNLPLIGWLFRGRDDDSTRSEIIVLLTPHIIDDEEAADKIGKTYLAEAKRRCLGMREGFYCFTTERMTVGYLEEADRFWTQYQKTKSVEDLDDAWWNLSLALNTAPNNLKALRMKDKILTEKNGEPYVPATTWTIWDTLHQRMKALDEAKREAAAPKAEPVATPPKADAAETPKVEATAVSEQPDTPSVTTSESLPEATPDPQGEQPATTTEQADAAATPESPTQDEAEPQPDGANAKIQATPVTEHKEAEDAS